LLLAADVHPLVVQARLGHGSLGMTVAYSHVSVELQRDAAVALSAAIDEAIDEVSSIA
jgi:hypothetical protein